MDGCRTPKHAAFGPGDRPLARVCYGAMLAGVLVAACSDTADRPDGSDQAKAASADRPQTDLNLLTEAPDHPVGEDGFSRYVYREVDGRVVPSLIEGPATQVRCQDEALPCSYLELKALYESSAEIPEELHIARKELGELVGQLDVLSATLAQYHSIGDACAAGFRVRSKQKKNMGIHVIKPGTSREFDPAHPQMLLFAKDGGQRYSRKELGQCVGDRWEGDQDYQIVGAAFMLQLTDEHPAGFAGPLDNWHTHFNACVDSDNEPIPQHHGSRAGCEAAGGTYMDPSPWMLHVYVVPEFDSQSGVFAMHNESVWPVVDPEKLRTHSGTHSAHH